MRSVLLICVFGSFLWTGCATTRTITSEPADIQTRLMTARGSKETKIVWDSKSGCMYHIFYKDEGRTKSKWLPLDGATNIMGTGQRITIIDQPPRGVKRNYRSQTIPLKRAKKLN